MQEKIESEERDNSNRASFICPNCKNSYTDLQVNQLLDITTGKLFCTFCTTEVKEDESAGPKTDSRTLLAKFNVQIAPLFELLKETENIEFTPTMTDPEPSFVPFLHADDESDNFGPGPGQSRAPGETNEREKWSDSNRRHGFNEKIEVTVSMGEEAEKKAEVSKVVPTWMTESTVVIESGDDIGLNPSNPSTFNPAESQSAYDEIDDLLTNTETTQETKQENKTENENEDSSDDDFIDADEEDERLTVQGKSFSYEQIQNDPSLVKNMTSSEKIEYTNYVNRMMEDYM